MKSANFGRWHVNVNVLSCHRFQRQHCFMRRERLERAHPANSDINPIHLCSFRDRLFCSFRDRLLAHFFATHQLPSTVRTWTAPRLRCLHDDFGDPSREHRLVDGSDFFRRHQLRDLLRVFYTPLVSLHHSSRRPHNSLRPTATPCLAFRLREWMFRMQLNGHRTSWVWPLCDVPRCSPKRDGPSLRGLAAPITP